MIAQEMDETLKERTAKGLFWGGMNNGVLQLVGVVFGILLGRMLDRHDFGMMALIGIFSLLATAIQDSGFKTALANIKQPTMGDYNAVFWFNILVGSGLYVVLFLAAPLIARFYPEEDSDALVRLCRYAFLSIIIASLGTAQNAFLFKNLMAKQQAKASIIAVMMSSCVATAMAFCGMAYWSLATQGLVYVSVYTAMAWYYSPWRPSFSFDFSPIRRMFRFSYKILATTITVHINNNILNLLLGHYFGTNNAGIYNQAYQWNFKSFTLVQNMVGQVAQPVLVTLNDEKSRQLNAFRKLMRFTAFISFPLMFGLGLVAKEFIVITIKAKWLPSAELLQLLCIGGAFFPLIALMSNMIVSKGKSNIYLGCTAALGVLQIALMLLIWPLGIHTMVAAYVVLNIGWMFVWYYFVRRLTGYRLLLLLKDILPFALAAAGTMFVTYLLTRQITNPYLLLAVRMVSAATLYYITMRLARAEILKECIQFIVSRFRKK